MRPFFLAILAALGIGLVTFSAFFFRPKISISVEPATATITFSGNTTAGNGIFTVLPGEYELAIEQEGFIPLRRTERLRVGERLDYTITLKPIPQPSASTTEQVLLVGLSADKKSVVYIGNQGKTFLSRNGGQEKTLTPDSFDNPSFFSVSPNQDVAVFRDPNGELFLHDFKRYNLVEQEQFLYGRDIGAIDWIYPDGSRLLYSYAPASGERSLVAADRTNKNLERVLNLNEAGIADPTVAVSPDGKMAILISRPGGDFKNYNMYLFDLFTKRARQFTTDGSKIDARFKSGGTRILYTHFEEDPNGLNNQLLSVMDADGRNRKDFNIRATLDQVDFLSDTQVVVAATEKGGDRLYRLDLSSGDIEPYYHGALRGIHFTKLVLSGDKSTAYVTGSSNAASKSGMLYSIKLETDEYD